MSRQTETKWMVTFWHSKGDIRSERNFPKFRFWHANREASLAEGKRVLDELHSKGDKRDWNAAGFPDPFEVGAGRHPAENWVLSNN